MDAPTLNPGPGDRAGNTRDARCENVGVKTAIARANHDSRDRRVARHLDLIPPIARAIKAWVGKCAELDDLVAYGSEGLLAAASRFDATKGVSFEAFARRRIWGAIIDGVRREGWFGRRAYRRLKAGQVGIVDSAANDPRSAVVLPAGLTIIRSGHGTGAGGDDGLAEIADRDLGDQAARWNGRRMVQLAVEDAGGLHARAKANLSLLPARERRLLELRYYQGKTLSQAAREMGFRRSWASRLHARALATLAAAMHAHFPYRRKGVGGNDRPPPSRHDARSPSQ